MHDGEAAQPPEAHHPEDGDQLGGRRVRWPCPRQRQHGAKVEAGQAEKSCRVSVGPADEGHRVQRKLKRMEQLNHLIIATIIYKVIYHNSFKSIDINGKIMLVLDYCNTLLHETL